MRRRIAPLHPPIMSRANQPSITRKNGRTDGDATFSPARTRLAQSGLEQFMRVETGFHSVQNSRSGRLVDRRPENRPKHR